MPHFAWQHFIMMFAMQKSRSVLTAMLAAAMLSSALTAVLACRQFDGAAGLVENSAGGRTFRSAAGPLFYIGGIWACVIGHITSSGALSEVLTSVH